MDYVVNENVSSAIGDMRAFQKPGLETFRRYIRGELPGPPMSKFVGMRPTEAMCLWSAANYPKRQVADADRLLSVWRKQSEPPP